MNELKDLFEVIECEGYPGLTVGSHLLKPGVRFTRQAWPYGAEGLDAAINSKRCKEIVGLAKKRRKEKETDDIKKSSAIRKDS